MANELIGSGDDINN